MSLLPITARTAASAAACVVSSGSFSEYRYLRASSTWYCTVKSTARMFSSRVSRITLSVTERTRVASTLVTDSIGCGNLRWKPGDSVREYWPKRSTTPACRALTMV